MNLCIQGGLTLEQAEPLLGSASLFEILGHPIYVWLVFIEGLLPLINSVIIGECVDLISYLQLEA
eukprot:1098690-Pelagomonas_calceolata.AAC.6